MFDKEILDDDGYPTQEYLDWLGEWKNVDHRQRIKDILESLHESWYFGDWGYKIHRPYSGNVKIELHTGGWSGNEDIIYALKQNVIFWYHWRMSKVGGHYYFEFETEDIR